MASFKPLTSEEALEDYFSALLNEEIIELEDDQNIEIILPEPEPEPEPEITWTSEAVMVEDQVTSHYQPQLAQHIDDDDEYPFELPQLEDVQRLLSQLENSQLEVQVEIDSLITDAFVKQEKEDLAVETTMVSQDVVNDIESEESEEELDLSDWDISDKIVTKKPEEIKEFESISEEPAIDSEIKLETQTGKSPPLIGLDWKNSELDEEFQVLFFEVMGVTFAVPLAQLGGIHQITELNHLIGRPDWYLGLQNNRETTIDALDTAKWVMPQSIKDESYKENYQYLVMLGDSKWGLACNALAGTETLTSDRIRWRETAGKRPWLSGMVKEKMCALIHVEAMITMLNAGLDIKGIE